MKNKRIGAALLLVPVALSAGAGTRDDIQALQIGQQEMQERVERLESSVQNRGLLEMSQMLGRLQQDVRELRGLVEQQGHELERLRERQRELYLDIDRRLNDLQLRGSGATLGGADTGLPAGGASPGTGAGDEGAEDGGSSSTGDAEQERADYKAAFTILREGQYDRAVAAFSEFLKKYPEGDYADNAQYWLGEANYVSRNFEQALVEFGKVLDRHPRSTKVPDAKLKLGYTYYELEQWNKARDVLSGIVKMHPDTSVAPLAEKRLARMNDEGH